MEKIISFIAAHQEKNGAFDQQMTFHTSLILLCIRYAESDKAEDVKKQASEFLLKERSSSWSFNYWQRHSKESKEKPYPDDLDDTCCALAALTLNSPESINGETLAHLVRTLTLCETAPGGPYETWILPKEKKLEWHDIDPGVNANIAYVLNLHDIRIPSLQTYLEKIIETESYSSKYYESPLVILYFISRSYQGPLSGKAADFIQARQDKNRTWGNDLETALAISALINFGAAKKNTKKAIASLEKAAAGNTWKPEPFYIEENKSKKIYSGSPALTAAFAYEALYLYYKKGKETVKPGPKETRMHRLIINEAQKRFPVILKPLAEYYVQKITQGDKRNQITLLPLYFYRSLKQEKRLPAEFLKHLDIANLHGWIAFRIYDDLLDNEGDAAHIPLANISLREVERIYEGMHVGTSIDIFRKIMDGIEEANYWERVNCFKNAPHYETYDVLAEKSLGHAQGPIAILLKLGYGPKSKEVRQTLLFFKHYLIARQLNDDAHDWSKDLEKGFINSVGVQVIKRQRKDSNLQEIFWNETILKIAEDIFFHIKEARKALRNNKAVKDKSYLESLLIPIENGTQKALTDRKKMLEFIATY